VLSARHGRQGDLLRDEGAAGQKEAMTSLSERLKNLEAKGLVALVAKKRAIKIHPPIPLPDDIAQKYLSEDRNDGR
jgi:hypothetical protein